MCGPFGELTGVEALGWAGQQRGKVRVGMLASCVAACVVAGGEDWLRVAQTECREFVSGGCLREEWLPVRVVYGMAR